MACGGFEPATDGVKKFVESIDGLVGLPNVRTRRRFRSLRPRTGLGIVIPVKWVHRMNVKFAFLQYAKKLLIILIPFSYFE